MGNFIVKVNGPSMDIFRYLRERGFSIKEAKKLSKTQPTEIKFEDFEEFTYCVKHFHREPFIVETECEFDTEMSKLGNIYAPSDDEIEIAKELTDENHLKNVEIINAIIYWQTSLEITPFKCEINENHRPLFAGIDREANKVVMGCPDCDYIREDIPDEVLEYYNKNKKTEDDDKN